MSSKHSSHMELHMGRSQNKSENITFHGFCETNHIEHCKPGNFLQTFLSFTVYTPFCFYSSVLFIVAVLLGYKSRKVLSFLCIYYMHYYDLSWYSMFSCVCLLFFSPSLSFFLSYASLRPPANVEKTLCVA